MNIASYTSFSPFCAAQSHINVANMAAHTSTRAIRPYVGEWFDALLTPVVDLLDVDAVVVPAIPVLTVDIPVVVEVPVDVAEVVEAVEV